MNYSHDPSHLYSLGIIIPAYKGRFLAEAIESVLAQSDQRFQLYVLDDCSPEPLGNIVHPILKGTRHTYFRFDCNSGGVSLADHWSRCVRLTSEPWIWVFSDDDVMEPGCVKRFHETLEQNPGGFNVFRFNTSSITETSQIIRINPPHPQFEPAIQFAYHRLRGERLSFAPEYLFSREAFDQVGGFIPFPAAWGSDDASWIAFAGDRPIVTISGCLVRWRISRENVSGTKSAGTKKVEASLQYIDWLLEWSRERQIPGIDAQVLRRESEKWVPTQLAHLQRCLRWGEILSLSGRLASIWRKARRVIIPRLLLYNLRFLKERIYLNLRDQFHKRFGPNNPSHL